MNDDQTTTPVQTVVLASRAEEARGRLNQANRRLVRAGIAELFTWTETPGTVTVQEVEGEVEVSIITFEINRPAICYGGWEFMASVDVVDSGVLVNTVPGLSLGDIPRPEDHRCEHCKTNRARKYTYLLRNEETGEVVQVGKTCLELFLGVRPSALWVLGYGIGELEFCEGAGYTDYDRLYTTRSILKMGWIASERGTNYVSRKKAREYGGMDTAALVDIALIGSAGAGAYRAEHGEISARIRREYLDVEDELVDAMIETGTDLPGDYGANLGVVLASENVSPRNFALLISVIGVYMRECDRRSVRAGGQVSRGFLAEVGEKIRGVPATIRTLRDIYGEYGTTTLLIAQTGDGKLIKWFGRVPTEVGGTELEVGQDVVFDVATVKAHEEYNGDDQTRVIRAKMSRPADHRLHSAA